MRYLDALSALAAEYDTSKDNIALYPMIEKNLCRAYYGKRNSLFVIWFGFDQISVVNTGRCLCLVAENFLDTDM